MQAAPQDESVESDLGVVSVTLLAVHGGLADGLEFGSVADFVEHVVVVYGWINAEIALGVGLKKTQRGFFPVEPGEHGGAEIPGVWVGQ